MVMNKNTYIESKVYGKLTREQAIEILRQQIADQLSQPRTVSFGKDPKNGWTDSDRVAK